MKVPCVLFRIAILALLVQGVAAQHSHHSASSPEEPKSEKTYLLDEFGALGHCDFTARFDNLFAELTSLESAQGYIIFYNGKDVLPARYDEPSQQRLFQQHLAFRNFDPSRVTSVNGGFRNEMRAEIWIVQKGGAPPQPSETVSAPVIPLDTTFVFDSRPVLLDDGGVLLREFELPSVAAQRAAEEAAAEAEYQREHQEQAPSEPEPADQTEPVATGEDAEEEFVDPRTPEEIEVEKFDWTSEKFGRLLANRKDARGVIILYADDQIFDITRLQQFIEQGRKRIADASGISPGRISVEFGGYRDTVESEFWIVPKKGIQRKPKPGERPVEDPESSDN